MPGVVINGQLQTPTITSVTVTTLPALVAGNANIGDVDVATIPPITGDVDQQPKPSSVSTAAAQVAQGMTAAQVLAANGNRRGFIVQNTGTTIIKLNLGTVAPTQTAYHIALKASTAADDGSGGVYFDNQWKGAVQAISSGAGGTLVVTELT